MITLLGRQLAPWVLQVLLTTLLPRITISFHMLMYALPILALLQAQALVKYFLWPET